MKLFSTLSSESGKNTHKGGNKYNLCMLQDERGAIIGTLKAEVTTNGIQVFYKGGKDGVLKLLDSINIK